jgi:hypothetical protein
MGIEEIDNGQGKGSMVYSGLRYMERVIECGRKCGRMLYLIF